MRSIWRPFSPPPLLSWGSRPAKLIWLALAAAAGLAIATLPLTAAGLLVAGLAVLAAVLIEPLVGLALTLLAGPFGALESVLLGGSALDSGQLLLALTLAAWLARGVVRREIRFPAHFQSLAAPLALFMGLGALSLLKAPSLTHGFKELAKWLQMGLVAWLVADSAGRKSSRLYWVAAALLLAGLSQALIGLWQFGLRGEGPEHFKIMLALRGMALEAYRAYGTFEQPNPFAGFLGLTLPLALGWAAGLLGSGRVKTRAPQSWVKPALLALAAGLLGLGMLASWSRGGWLGGAAGLVAILFFLPRRRWAGLLLILALLALGWAALQSGLLPGSVAERLTGFGDYVQFQDVRGVDITPGNYAVLERMAHWQAALNMVQAKPWLGVGLGNYEPAYADYALINWPYPLGHAHNIYLNLLAESGVLGLAAYLGFWAAVIWLTARAIGRLSYPERGLALGLMGVWVHLAVHQMVDNLYVNNIYLHLGALLGLLLLLQGKPRGHEA